MVVKENGASNALNIASRYWVIPAAMSRALTVGDGGKAGLGFDFDFDFVN